MADKLLAALASVDWKQNSDWLGHKKGLAARIEACNTIIAVWAKQLEKVEKGAPSLSFVREMQHAGHHAACFMGLALYKPAAGAMRAMLECALYYCYFRTHSAELQTLVRDDRYYLSKKDVLDFFKRHVVDFQKKQEKLNLVTRIEQWYSKTSAVVHGQIPGVWSQGSSVAEFVHQEAVILKAIEHFEAGALIVRDLFLCTIAVDLWAGFSPTAKKAVLSGVPTDVCSMLKLDSA